jgi:hypothetical protein
VTTYQRPPEAEEPPPNGQWTTALALWAGLTALFANLAAINLIAFLGDESDTGMQAIAAVISAVIVAASIYSKQRYDDEKAKRAWRSNGVDRRRNG